ncbi:hypothetical protein [Ruminococcus sp.]|uniref:Ig-like domain-containing protein n=1 Tax=Ruminococcus sp. TaxID=41978 RepID=UPI0025EDC772|nr:hypothetical protein [Ruminococcus sp.]MBR1433104.1 hypothetical protein [Ruminococcus sp.]
MRYKVELINNPYSQKLRILINGEAVSSYSNLIKYVDEPFYYWCDRIFDDIYEECNNSDFSLHFRSRSEEIEILKKLSYNYTHCIQYSSSLLVRPTPLIERIKSLNKILKENNRQYFRKYDKIAIFIIPDSLSEFDSDLLGMEVRNTFCHIGSKVIHYSELKRTCINGDIIFLISTNDDVDQLINQLKSKLDFLILIGKEQRFVKKNGNAFFYEAKKDMLFDTIFECLLFKPLTDIFNDCIVSLSDELKRQYKDELEILRSITVKVLPIPEERTIECGRSSGIHFKTDIEGYDVSVSELSFSYSDKGIIRCNGLRVEGLKPGKATLNVFRRGELSPCATVDYSVVKRNRINEIYIEDSVIVIGIGDKFKINYSYMPVDADNVNKIEWKAEDPSVVKVDNAGNIMGIKRGSSIIRCFAEQVSAKCSCTVKPYLKAITPEFSEINMLYGEEKELKIDLFPIDCIDEAISVSSIDMQVANVYGRTIQAIGIGSTTIVIQNISNSVRAEVKVNVLSGNEKKNNSSRKKITESLFSFLKR